MINLIQYICFINVTKQIFLKFKSIVETPEPLKYLRNNIIKNYTFSLLFLYTRYLHKAYISSSEETLR